MYIYIYICTRISPQQPKGRELKIKRLGGKPAIQNVCLLTRAVLISAHVWSNWVFGPGWSLPSTITSRLSENYPKTIRKLSDKGDRVCDLCLWGRRRISVKRSWLQ